MQNIFDQKDRLTSISIKLKDIGVISDSDFEDNLYYEPGIQVVSLAQVRGAILNLVSSAKVMTNAIAFIAVFIAGIGTTNTMLISVFERTAREG